MSSTLTDEQENARHWAAVAIGLKEAREKQGNPLTAEERVHFDRYQANARSHGFTDAQIRAYQQSL